VAARVSLNLLGSSTGTVETSSIKYELLHGSILRPNRFTPLRLWGHKAVDRTVRVPTVAVQYGGSKGAALAPLLKHVSTQRIQNRAGYSSRHSARQ
jgi:hypothetical protein